LLPTRHGLRASEVADLEWNQVELGRNATLHVRRAKNGKPSARPLRADEVRALRELRRAAMPMLHPAFIVLLAPYGLSGLLGVASYFDEDRLVRIDTGAIGRVPFCHPFIDRRLASGWL
jgi:integrase